MKYHSEQMVDVPIYFNQLSLLANQGVKLSATITYSPSGYQIRFLMQSHEKGFMHHILCAERTKKPRNFKTADSALKACRDLGVTLATISL